MQLHQTTSKLLFQLRVLYRVFLLRVVDLELLSSDGDPSRLMGQFAAVFVSISFFCSFPAPYLLWGRTPIPVPMAYMFEHFIIETTMTVAGLIAVLSWDSAFPDRRDMLVLGPLPVRRATLFFAKIAALFAAPTLAMLSFNLCLGFSWPMVFAVGVGGDYSLLRTFPAYWFTVLAAGAFLVFTVFALQGLAANLLPRQIFLHLSAALQAAALCLLLSAYFLGPSFNSPAALADPHNQRILHWLPAYWFLGLFNQLNGSMHPELVPLAHRAWIALGASASAACAGLLLYYLRMLRRIVEQPDILPVTRSGSIAFTRSLTGVITLFSLRTLMRSRLHRMILSFYVGIGLTVILGFTHTKFATVGASTEHHGIDTLFLLASILTVSLTVLALRIVISIPIELKANWIFRLTQVRPAWSYHRAVRGSFLLLAVVPCVLALSTAFFAAYPVPQLIVHLVVMALLGALIAELCLLTFRKISFACSYLPGKANLHFVFWIALLGSIKWLHDAASAEGRILNSPRHIVLLLLLLADAVIATHFIASAGARRTGELTFEEEDLAGMVTLKLR